MSIIHPFRWLTKPLLGAEIDRAHPRARNLVGYWLMNEGAGTKALDASGNNNHGSITDAIWTDSERGRTLWFDGNADWVAVPNSSSLSPSKSITLSLWFNTTQSTSLYERTLLWKEYSYGLYRAQKSTNNVLTFMIRSGASSKYHTYTHTAALNDGKWHHLLCAFNGDYVWMWLDGRQVLYSDSAATQIDVTSNPVYMGSNSASASTKNYEGYLSDIQIWSRALTASEIASLYADPYQMFRRRPIVLATSGATNVTVTPSALGLSLDAASPSLLYDYAKSVSGLAASLAIQDPTVTIDSSVSASTLDVTLAWHDPSVAFDMAVAPDGQSMSLSVQSPDVALDAQVQASAQAMTLTFHGPSTAYDYVQTVAALALTLTRNDPTINTEVVTTVQADALGITMQVQSPSTAYDMTVLAEALAAALQQPSVTVRYDCLVAIGAALSLLNELHDPTVSMGVNVTIAPTAQGLQLSLQSPSTAYDFRQVVAALGAVAVPGGVELAYDFGFDVSALPIQMSLHAPDVWAGTMLYAAAFWRLKKAR